MNFPLSKCEARTQIKPIKIWLQLMPNGPSIIRRVCVIGSMFIISH